MRMLLDDGRQGYLRTNLSGKLSYQSFVPSPLQDILPLDLDNETIGILGACSRKIGELEGMIQFVPNAPMYLAMYVRKEALLSAQIEGTQCTFDDLLDPGRNDLTNKDVADVVSYVRAVEFAVNRLKELPLCMRLLREVHGTLLEGTRGAEKNPGEIRASQNWIGPAGCTIETAAYVPPNIQDMQDALSDLERFINSDTIIDPIIKAALVHYQFETIHPFLDGNGRLGRLLITLSLMNDGVLSNAVFYPSYQLKLNRSEYYAQLTSVRERGTYELWVAFFCQSILESANDAVDSLYKLIHLKEANCKKIVATMGRASENGRRLLDLLEGNPIVGIGFIAERLGVVRTTAASLVKDFESMGILARQDDTRQRYRTYLYKDYMDILRQGSNPL